MSYYYLIYIHINIEALLNSLKFSNKMQDKMETITELLTKENVLSNFVFKNDLKFPRYAEKFVKLYGKHKTHTISKVEEIGEEK